MVNTFLVLKCHFSTSRISNCIQFSVVLYNCLYDGYCAVVLTDKTMLYDMICNNRGQRTSSYNINIILLFCQLSVNLANNSV